MPQSAFCWRISRAVHQQRLLRVVERSCHHGAQLARQGEAVVGDHQEERERRAQDQLGECRWPLSEEGWGCSIDRPDGHTRLVSEKIKLI